ncbi:MAG: hypothetical protein B6U85_10145 [Desulfurococcales archaeon ex4484_42]|nr:MAG: hypothetical protein B6U85_10145 [Desulfurococcales archaeon ex4484_42]
MVSEEVFEAISHPLRIKILKLLAKRPMGFAELKRELGIKSSGKLDFHLKKLEGLITLDNEGKYTLTKEGYAALQAITTIRKYGWQKRAFIIGIVTYIAALTYTLWVMIQGGIKTVHVVVLVLLTLWIIYYSYWSIVKRKVFKAY